MNLNERLINVVQEHLDDLLEERDGCIKYSPRYNSYCKAIAEDESLLNILRTVSMGSDQS